VNRDPDRRVITITIAAALQQGHALLAEARPDTPRLDAEVLLRHALDLDRTTLFARLTEPIPPPALAVYQNHLAQRARGVPVAYITGQREFMGFAFKVAPGALVPRPETETLVEWALSTIRQRNFSTVVDVGTGSGAIALSIAAIMGPGWDGRIIAADVSATALTIASRNRDQLIESARVHPSPTVVSQGEVGGGEARMRGSHDRPSPPTRRPEGTRPVEPGEGAFRAAGRPIGTQACVSLVRGSLLTWLGGPVDLILANLPYLRPDQIATNPDLAAEPRQALDGGADGLDLIRRLIADAPRVLAPGGALGLEIDPGQRDEVFRLARDAFPAADANALPDLAGLDRHIVVQTGEPITGD
jgi:release factor glutamine methyltransferase